MTLTSTNPVPTWLRIVLAVIAFVSFSAGVAWGMFEIYDGLRDGIAANGEAVTKAVEDMNKNIEGVTDEVKLVREDLTARLDEEMAAFTKSRYTMDNAIDDAYREAIANPGHAVPHPRSNEMIIVAPTPR